VSTSTSSTPTPSWSATICAQVVSGLTVRRRSGHHLHRSERLNGSWLRPSLPPHSGSPEDARRREPAHLVVRREADADLLGVFVLAPRRLIGSDRVQIEQLEQPVEGRCVVA
jgi:hypothetical protein